jgi:hypothetical protein
LPFVLYLDCHLFCIWIAICFVSGLPFCFQSIYKTNGNSCTKQMGIQIQSKWQSIYKTNGNPNTKQTAIQKQNK